MPPDLRVTNTQEDIKNNRDRVLEFAIDLLHHGFVKKSEKDRE